MLFSDRLLRQSMGLAIAFIGLLWAIKSIESALGVSAHFLGVYPRAMEGLIGIVTAPLIHGSWQHLLANTPPLFVLVSALCYGYPRSRGWTLVTIWLVSGLGVWWLGRPSFHFGASGLTHGLFFFVLVSGVLRRDKRSIALLMIAFFLYGSMLVSIFPQHIDISYEYHLGGALGGVLSALIFRHWDPLPQRAPYSWELADADNEDDQEDSIIGDQWQVDSQPDINALNEPMDSPPTRQPDKPHP